VEELVGLFVQFFFEILVQGLFELPGYILRWSFGVSCHADEGDVIAMLLSLGFWGAFAACAIFVWQLAR
jgi:hypothetical protein